ncbi:winged helix-turn-helix transcriptional regulator [Nitrososphaera sp.]|uniref:winged helix-turn-helix transcriptional regulator n=1 Tax=Nitrososphaera sp. TaxID=1971748 RepID=UPI001826EB59|nr:winged helix-turn-helix transcriptional regulator [Nitrososphaera sp.]NWG37827.1 HTH domain-containing protein [Nitrososphaera sp.]
MSALQITTEQDGQQPEIGKFDRSILNLLKQHGRTPAEIAEELNVSKRTVHSALERLEDKVAKVPFTHYYLLAHGAYGDKCFVYRAHFDQCSEGMKQWSDRAGSNPTRRSYINMMYRVCAGKLVPDFVMHPGGWEWPNTFYAFRSAWDKHYHKRAMPDILVKSLRAFAANALNIDLKSEYKRVESLELKPPKPRGKYRHIRLSLQEIDKAIAWIEGPSGREAAEKYILDSPVQPTPDQIDSAHDELKAHFAFSLEGCIRPSPLLWVKVEQVALYANKNSDGSHVRFVAYEPKTGDIFNKRIIHPILAEWAWHWKLRRLKFHYAHLFVDSNYYQPEKYESARLAEVRERFGACYRELFEYLGKQEDIYFQDTLYCMRHISAWFWIDRYGIAIIPRLRSMGWRSESTLLSHYVDIDDASEDMLDPGNQVKA